MIYFDASKLHCTDFTYSKVCLTEYYVTGGAVLKSYKQH